MLRDRLIFGPVLIALVFLVAWTDAWLDGSSVPVWLRLALGGRETFPPGTLVFVLSVIVSALASLELTRILRDKGIEASRLITWASAAAGLAVSGLAPANSGGVTAVAVASSAAAVVLLGALLYYSRRETAEGVVAAAGGAVLAFIYLGLMFGFVLTIRREHSVWVLLWVLAVTKSCDIGAYFVGRAIGRHKLIPWLSPGKTWEGLFGGVALSALVAAIGLAFVPMGGEDGVVLSAAWWMAALAGAVFGATGQLGDLMASLLKRDAGLKDASRRLPGFGGVLDVIDSPLLVMPVAYWWLALVSA